MLCPDCNGTTIRLLPIPWTRGRAWVKAPCRCAGGFTAAPIDWDTALASPTVGGE